MGLRDSVAANLVLDDKAPRILIDQLNDLCNAKPGDVIYDTLISGNVWIPETRAPIAALFRDWRHYAAVWKERSIVVPGKHYRSLGTTKHGDIVLQNAVKALEPYLDLEKSWFAVLTEGSEISAVRWIKIGDHFEKQEVMADLFFQPIPTPFVVSDGELEPVDCDYIPWWYAEPIAKTLGTREFNKVLKRLTRLKLGDGKVIVKYPVLDPNKPETSVRYRHRRRVAKRGSGRSFYRITTRYSPIKIEFVEKYGKPVNKFLEEWTNALLGSTDNIHLGVMDPMSITRGTNNE